MFTPEKTVLLVIDIQGKLAGMMHGKDRLFASVTTLITALQKMGIPIIWVEQLPEKLGPTIAGVSRLLSAGPEPIAKHTFSCCDNERFMETFAATGRSQVLLSGIESHICVYQTALALLDRGNSVQVVTDCVSSRTPENRQLGIDRICRAGGFPTSVEMICFELMKAARGDVFRQVVKLIK